MGAGSGGGTKTRRGWRRRTQRKIEEILRPEKENKKDKWRGGKEEERQEKKPRKRQRMEESEMEREGGQDTTKGRGN